MNQIIILGNGFDLCHGLETSYAHFYKDYLISTFFATLDRNSDKFLNYDDPLLSIIVPHSPFVKKEDVLGEKNLIVNSVKEVDERFEYIKSYFDEGRKLTFKNDFSDLLYYNFNKTNWVDIENLYYSSLIDSFKNRNINDTRNINDSLTFIIKKLTEYLINKATKKGTKNNQSITSIINNINAKIKPNLQEKCLILNFNYTETIRLYEITSTNNFQTIYLHGQISNISNPIIFGYGDETDEEYINLEKSPAKDIYLKYIKSFWYYKTDNYSKLFEFVNNENYMVNIIGHSCGTSDRTILTALFNNSNCKKINIYPYKKNEHESDIHDKILNINMHFPLSNKHDMRMKIKYDDNLSIITSKNL